MDHVFLPATKFDLQMEALRISLEVKREKWRSSLSLRGLLHLNFSGGKKKNSF